MIKILKASAGSGKTFRLAYEYIRLLFSSEEPRPYVHILAVTFTNKATDEMKQRILKELFILSNDSSKSKYTPRLLGEGVCSSESEIKKKALRHLTAILHDYSAFSVSTIDRFFQHTLKSFAREIGQFASYRVELDKDSLVEESVERILDSLTEKDTGMLAWLTENVLDGLQQGKKFKLDENLLEMAKSIKSEKFRTVTESHGIDVDKTYSPENIRAIKRECKRIEDAFIADVRKGAEDVVSALNAAGVDASELKGNYLKQIWTRGLLQLKEGDKVESPSSKFFDYSEDTPCIRGDKNGLRWRSLVDSGFFSAYSHLVDLLRGPRMKAYSSLQFIRKNLFDLGIASRLQKEFNALQREKNVISIDDSNVILRKIIDGSDAPFVYEKTGTRYDHFLLDEFQDTSVIQWQNFSPLVHNSVSEGFENLVVGDVKQSIYRFRDSDWHLLSSLSEEFDNDSASIESLTSNYRTLRRIVEFNNGLFAYLPPALENALGRAPESISLIYSDACQTIDVDNDAEGSVSLSFCEEKDSEMGEILSSIRSYMEKGGHLSDIAVLVRDNKAGAKVAAYLIENGIPVISDDSLNIKSSVTVRRLVSLMSLSNAPKFEDRVRVEAFLASSLDIEVPSSYRSIFDLAESILRDLRKVDEALYDAESLFIQSFMDWLQEWTSNNGNSLSDFLSSWKEASPKISSPDAGDSVRVMTIHKAKGLEFPYVILPFAEEITLYKASESWCVPSQTSSLPENVKSGAYKVNLSSKTDGTVFEEDYKKEANRQYIDNLNVLYVGMTRPKYNLKVIGGPSRFGNVSTYLQAFADTFPGMGMEEEEGVKRYFIGEVFIPKEEKKGTVEKMPVRYLSFASAEGDRLRFSPDAREFFMSESHVDGDAPRRLRGIVLHDILSSVSVPSDLEGAAGSAVFKGEIPESELKGVIEFLSRKIEGVKARGWFPEKEGRSRILNEMTLIAPDGSLHRPDRVIISGDAVRIVDYKFGERKPSYRKQIRRYVGLFKAMGYSDVKATLWYINEKGDDFFEED